MHHPKIVQKNKVNRKNLISIHHYKSLETVRLETSIKYEWILPFSLDRYLEWFEIILNKFQY